MADRRGSLPWGLVGMVVVVVAIESMIATHDLDFTGPWHWDWRTSNRTIVRKSVGRDVLIFGDSQVKFGVMPAVIQKLSGKSAYNFALHTGQTPSSYFLFRRALEAGARPSAVVLDLTPHMLAHSPTENRHLWPELLGTSEAIDLAWTMGDAELLGPTMLARLLPSYRDRFEIRAGLVATMNGSSVSRRDEIPRYRRNWKVNDGAQLMGERSPPLIDADHWVDRLYPRWKCQPVNAAYLDRFLALARDRQIPVYWLLPPTHPDVQAKTEASGFDADYTRFVEAVHARFPEVVVVDTRHSGFGAELFTDGIHLHRRGAMRLSAAIADVLKSPVPADRWVSIDLGRVAVVDLPIEDTNDSARILEAEATVRR